MGLFVPLLLVVVVFVVWHLVQERQRSKRAATLPGHYPIIGNSFNLGRNVDYILEWILASCVVNGRTTQFKVLGQPNYIVITDPDCVKHVLQDNFENYEKIFLRDKVIELIGDGIFNVDGAMWQFQRKIASQIFRKSELENFMGRVFVDHAQDLVTIIGQHADRGEAFDMQALLAKFTLDTIGQIAFGIDLQCLHKEHVPFAAAFDRVQAVANERNLTPFWQIRKHFKWLVPSERQVTRDMRVVNDFAWGVVRERHQSGDSHTRADLLSLFMQVKDEDGNPLSDKMLRDIVMSFIIAGRDTTANALTWAFFELMRAPAVEAQLVDAIAGGLGRDVPESTVQDRVPYARAVVKETLRLYPSVPKDAKTAVKADVLPDGTDIPAGATVVYFPWGMGRLSQLWPEPGAFKPERWMEEKTATSPFKFIAFNAGPRLCLGMNMAYLEAAIVLTTVMQKFTLRPAYTGTNRRYMSSLTLPMLDGLPVYASRRVAPA